MIHSELCSACIPPVQVTESSEYGNPIHSQNDVLIMLPIVILKI